MTFPFPSFSDYEGQARGGLRRFPGAAHRVLSLEAMT